MAVALFGSTSTFPREKHDFVYAASGATLDASNKLQLNWDLTVYNTATSEGEQRLLVAVRALDKMLEAALSRNATTVI